MTETPAGDSEQAFLDRAVVIALGSNLPGAYASSRALLDAALRSLDEHGLRVIRASTWWRSKAWPKNAGPDFLNGVALVDTVRTASDVLDTLLEIEREFGRSRGEANSPRTVDLDLIAHGRTLLDSETLALPHPRAAERRFVMGPLAEIAPDWRDPTTGRSAIELAALASVGRDARSTS